MKSFLTAACAMLSLSAVAQRHISLAGQWQSSLGEVELPGSLLTNDKGDLPSVSTRWTGTLYDSSYYYRPDMEPFRQPGRAKFPFFLTPQRHFVGQVEYVRSVHVPADWRGQHVELFLERPHIETTLFVNGHEVGHQLGLSAPHVYRVEQWLRPGEQNELRIVVYNGIENVGVGQDSHSVTDQTQGNWNGLAGRLELRARGRQPVEHINVFPDVASSQIRIEARSSARRLRFAFDGKPVDAKRQNDSTYIIGMANARLWSEFDPHLYRLSAMSKDDTLTTTFGMREISIEGRQFLLNGRPIWIRGTVDSSLFPLTGYPPTDVDSWLSIFRKCREYGLNMMRFHSYCPPEAAFEAADQLGFYLQPEGPSWPNHGVKLGEGQIIDSYLMQETQRMVEAYGNHPSFVMMASGNEPAGRWVEWTAEWCDFWRQRDNRRVYCGASVGGGWQWDPGSDFHVKGGARGLDWNRHAPHSMDDYNADVLRPRNFVPTAEQPVNTAPYLSHEQGQWCAFPDLSERSQYTGAYKATNFDIFAHLLRQNGMQGMARRFLMASGHLQVLAYKYELERNLRTRDYAGFQLLGLNDYSGQGSAIVGTLNVFWREKGYVTGLEWRQFCNDVVPLVRLPKMVFTNAESLETEVEVYNASGRALHHARVCYSLVNPLSGDTLSSGLLHHADIALGKNQSAGSIQASLADCQAPAKLLLAVEVNDATPSHQRRGSSAQDHWRNEWEVWVYPAQLEMPRADASLLVADTLDERALAHLSQGGTVLIEAAGRVRYGNDIKQMYLPVFWNTSWFKMRPPHTTGAAIASEHPLFREFPTDDWANLNWWELLNRAQVMNLSRFPLDYQSPIQPIDTWHLSRKLGMLLEARVGGGRLLMTTMDLNSDLAHRPAARQMRYALLCYAMSPAFNPTMEVEPELIRQLFEEEAPAVDMFTNDSPDELKPKFK